MKTFAIFPTICVFALTITLMILNGETRLRTTILWATIVTAIFGVPMTWFSIEAFLFLYYANFLAVLILIPCLTYLTNKLFKDSPTKISWVRILALGLFSTTLTLAFFATSMFVSFACNPMDPAPTQSKTGSYKPSSGEFFNAAEENNLNALIANIDAGVDINAKDEFGYSALLIAISKGNDNISRVLIERGIDVNLTDVNGQTALHYTALFNKTETAISILQAGGDIHVADIYDNQPLWTAVFNVKGRAERMPLVKLYLDHDADPTHKNKAGRSPLDFAKQVSNAGLIKILSKD